MIDERQKRGSARARERARLAGEEEARNQGGAAGGSSSAGDRRTIDEIHLNGDMTISAATLEKGAKRRAERVRS
eukprot:2128265-Pleurochrysis_carterae.AAC.1